MEDIEWTPRDPARIDAVLSQVKAYWKAHPDLRLGQIVVNASSNATGQMDPFNVEDDILVTGLR